MLNFKPSANIFLTGIIFNTHHILCEHPQEKKVNFTNLWFRTTKAFFERKFISSQSITWIIWFDINFDFWSSTPLVCNSFHLFLLRDISARFFIFLSVFFSVDAHYILLLLPLFNFIVSKVPREKWDYQSASSSLWTFPNNIIQIIKSLIEQS